MYLNVRFVASHQISSTIHVANSLRTHVVERSHNLVARDACSVGVDCLCNAKVNQLYNATGQNEICWL